MKKKLFEYDYQGLQKRVGCVKGWHIGSPIYRFTDISVKPIYQHFLKYRLSVKVRPQSVDSWDGGSTDELQKAAVEKKIGKNVEKF